MPAVLVVEVIFFSPFKRFETKTEKSGRLLFHVFCLRRLKRAGIRPQPQGLRASKSRKALMLGVKTGGVPLGLQTRQAVLNVFV